MTTNKPISQNPQNTKLNGTLTAKSVPSLGEDRPSCESKNGKAKSRKARIVGKIARLVRQEGLTYDDVEVLPIACSCSTNGRTHARRPSQSAFLGIGNGSIHSASINCRIIISTDRRGNVACIDS